MQTELICGRFCAFYKPGNKEEMMCGTFDFLARNLSPGELRRASDLAGPECTFSVDDKIRGLVCSRCEFAVDGCDFRAGLDSPPCGGYNIVEALLLEAAGTNGKKD